MPFLAGAFQIRNFATSCLTYFGTKGKDTDKDAARRIRTGIQTRSTLAVEILNYRKDGRPFWNQFSLTPVFAPGGEVCTHYIAVQYEHPLVVNGRNQGVEFVSPVL